MAAAQDAAALLASYPKSGRTWFRFILANYFVMASGREFPLDLQSMFAIVPNFALDPVRGVTAFQFAKAVGDVPMVLVTHDRYRPMRFARSPIIFMVRDPRDVMVSAYFHATRHKKTYSGDIDTFVHDAEHGLPRLIRYLNGWADGLRSHRHLVLSYERLSEDTEATTADALRFLGREVDEPALRRAIEVSCLDRMRKVEQIGGIPAHNYDRSDPEALRVRRGKVGGFTDYLDPTTIEWIEESCVHNLTSAARSLLTPTGCARA